MSASFSDARLGLRNMLGSLFIGNVEQYSGNPVLCILFMEARSGKTFKAVSVTLFRNPFVLFQEKGAEFGRFRSQEDSLVEII